MAINLRKGQQISLDQEAPNLTRFMFSVGWERLEGYGGLLGLFKLQAHVDLDVSVLCLNPNDKLTSKSDVVYFGNLQHNSSAIIHLGDDYSAKEDGDDEDILVNLSKIPDTISKLIFVVNIYDCIRRKQNFGRVKNTFMRLVDLESNQEIAYYSLSECECQGKTGIILAEVYRHNSEWKMAAIGEGINVKNIQGIVNKYC